MKFYDTAEGQRLLDSEKRRADWKKWGPYVSERAWGTVREDYSPNGDSWSYFPHDHARSRAYRWNEDGLAGVCNRFQNLCLGLALWNEQDPFLKERLFGLTGPQGNHGEDVKEYYYYLDSTPTHSYMKMLYKYPQVAFPYQRLEEENRRRTRFELECELIDLLYTEFAEGRYFDIFIEYAKADQEDLLCRITAINRGPEPASLHLLPHIWFRNNWSWGYNKTRPLLQGLPADTIVGAATLLAEHPHLGQRWWATRSSLGEMPALLFTENETNFQRLFGLPNPGPYVKDGIHEAVVNGRRECVNPQMNGTKAAAHYQRVLEPAESWQIWVRFSPQLMVDPFSDFEACLEQRQQEADEFYAVVQHPALDEDGRRISRQAFAGLLWSKQFYHYSVELWLKGDPTGPQVAEERRRGRNRNWPHLYSLDVISMPDKWEYPWFAAWDLAFHTLPLALVDPEWARRQLILMLREWYMHPNGQIPAYEWNFDDVNPPVHAWAVWRVYKITRNVTGHADTVFLEQAFHKLLLNFTWWVNRKDTQGNNIFQGGFLGLDNIGVFDRSAPLPTGGYIEQADGTAWMGMYCLNMLAIALELARTHPAYEDVATKFFEHFIYIAHAIANQGGEGQGLWDETDGFFYDAIHLPDGQRWPLRLRSFVGLIPLFAVEAIEPDLLERLPRFRRRMEWFLRYRPHLVQGAYTAAADLGLAPMASLTEPGQSGRRLLALVDRHKLERLLVRMFDESQFLSPYGLRSLSREHADHPYTFWMGGHEYKVAYEPADSTSDMFGGNSNWRGPVWFPINYLMIEALQKFHHYYGESFQVEVPHGSGHWVTLGEAADEIRRRLICIFRRAQSETLSNGPTDQPAPETGRRPVFGGVELFQRDPHWRDYLLFYEYFHGDNGAGIGASHQTGWTALVAKLLQAEP